MKPTSASTPQALLASPRMLHRAAAALCASALIWLLGSWGAMRGWLTLPYTVDVPATLLCATLMLALGMVAAWRAWQLQQEHSQASRKHWLSVLVFQRDEVDRAAQALASASELLESWQHSKPTAGLARNTPAALNVTQLQRISPELQPVLARQSGLRQHMQSLQARLVNLQVKFGRGDSLDALAYDVHPLTHEYQQLDSLLSQLFDELQSIDRSRIEQWTLYQQQQAEHDSDAEQLELLTSVQSQIEQAREALAHSLGEAPPERPVHLDDYLGLRP